jgi:DNA gyrase subunit B
VDFPPHSAVGWCVGARSQRGLGGGLAALASVGLGRPRYAARIQPASAEHGPALVIERDQHGLRQTQVLPAAFFASADFRPIADAAAELAGLVQPGAEVRRGDRRHTVSSFANAYAWLMDEAKRGRTISRFKGLGEMNPEQLWDTTVNPDTRRLLQVRIEDAVAADQIFSTLMGDVVEPRREFIEQNALRVSNLDV